MDQRVTRRVVLGTVIGGLVAGPFVMHFLRKNQRQLVGTASDPYGKIVLPIQGLDSILSKKELTAAFDVLQRERNMWLQCRGVEGFVQSETELLEKQQEKLAKQGFLSFKFDYPITSDRKFGELTPVNYRMSFSESKTSPPLWTLTLKDRSGAKPEFTGQDVPGMEYGTVFQLLVVATAMLSSYSNGAIEDISQLFTVFSNQEAGALPESYVFGPNDKLTSDHFLVPTLKFANGHFSEYLPKRPPGVPYPVISMENIVVSNAIAFPTKIVMQFNGNGKALPPDQNRKLTFSFSDINVFRA